jgi:hypothetical protein
MELNLNDLKRLNDGTLAGDVIWVQCYNGEFQTVYGGTILKVYHDKTFRELRLFWVGDDGNERGTTVSLSDPVVETLLMSLQSTCVELADCIAKFHK